MCQHAPKSEQPNAETLEAMQNVLEGKNLSGPYHTIEELMAALEEDDDTE